MSSLSIFSLFVNGLTLSLALAFLIIILWFDIKKPLLQAFSLLLMSITLWNGASLLAEVTQLIDPQNELGILFSLIGDIGFASASVTLYVFVSSLIVAHTRLFRILALFSLSLIVLNNLIVLQSIFSDISTQSLLSVPAVGVSALYFLLFDIVTMYLIVRYRRKLRSRGLMIGLSLFILGQGLTFLNPELGIASLALLISSVSALIVSFSVVQLELILPLGERVSQVEAMQQISLSIMQRSELDMVVNEVTEAVVKWLDANAAIVYLVKGDEIDIASAFRIPEHMIFASRNRGVAGETLLQRKALLYENYARDWAGAEDFELAKETAGAVMSVPLFDGDHILGVLLVIAGQRGKLFDNHDLRLLEQLSNQVAIAISHSQLLSNVKSAHNQLQTVLTSTDNPVIAIDRKLRIVFVNPSATTLINEAIEHKSIDVISGSRPIPSEFLPTNTREFMFSIRQKGYFLYEYELDGRIYLCRIAPLGSTRIEGWVAVLNDVTNLMELDRMKSEMVRMTSHDLKNPLQAAMANLDLLREDIDTSNAEAVLSLDSVEKQLDKMFRIIGGILDLERLKMGHQMYNESLDMYILLEQVYEEVNDYAQDSNVNLRCNFENLRNKIVSGDFNQLKRVFVNLMENAIKFTPSSGLVLLEGDIFDSQIVVRVRDNGVGIPAELQDKIFDRFFRGQQENFQHVSGSGLGLSFVKSIVQNHAGNITVESGPDQGSCFSVFLNCVE